ncbi:hypothetical protein [Streptomyces sp. NPDC060022]|uniref:hypothetical protein n=1 Tax=Streptomyces sp. NPDC060022 TaxID=3347039 RepID=UPI0036B54CA7
MIWQRVSGLRWRFSLLRMTAFTVVSVLLAWSWLAQIGLIAAAVQGVADAGGGLGSAGPRPWPPGPAGECSPHLPVGERDIPVTEPSRWSARFQTYRNYQFAEHLSTHRNAPPECIPPQKPSEVSRCH